jgi:hypothetical protein
MRDVCDGCPCLEKKDGRLWCFWYQGWTDDNNGCGNDFQKKPRYTQSQLEKRTWKQYSRHIRRYLAGKKVPAYLRDAIKYDIANGNV